jgi:hypothetical protein
MYYIYVCICIHHASEYKKILTIMSHGSSGIATMKLKKGSIKSVLRICILNLKIQTIDLNH